MSATCRVNLVQSKRFAFTIIELLVSIAVISILLSMLIVSVQSVRESARKTQCQNNLRQTMFALIQIVDTAKLLPNDLCVEIKPQIRGNSVLGSPFVLIAQHLSIPCIAFQGKIRIDNDKTGESFPPNLFTCPSTGDRRLAIRMNLGVERQFSFEKGIDDMLFRRRRDGKLSLSGVTDGLSNTIAFAERPAANNTRIVHRAIAVDGSAQAFVDMPTYCSEAFRDGNVFNGDSEWWSAGVYESMYDHSRVPNSTSVDCVSSIGGLSLNSRQRILISSRSYHPGGVNATALDGSVRFVSSSIDSVSWRALGTHNAGDVISEQ